ncbi:MAG: hypothetical protein HUU43_12240 [Ignavibacteriaceae bacterium]|nr:hypothetical protein [Ignavibacteriaceae bacterium]
MNKRITVKISRLLAISLLIYNLGIAFHYHHIDLCLDCAVKITSPGESHHNGMVTASDCPVILHSSNNPADNALPVVPETVFCAESLKLIYESATPFNIFHVSNSLRAPPPFSA